MNCRVLVTSIYLLTTVAVAQDAMSVQRPDVKVGETWTYVVLDWDTTGTTSLLSVAARPASSGRTGGSGARA